MITEIFLDTIRQHRKELLSCWSAFYLYRVIHNVAILVQVPFFFPPKQINYFTFTVLS